MRQFVAGWSPVLTMLNTVLSLDWREMLPDRNLDLQERKKSKEYCWYANEYKTYFIF